MDAALSPRVVIDMAETQSDFSPVLLAGNFLSASGGSRSVLEDLGERLEREGCRFIGVSRYRNGWIRGADLMLTALRSRCRVAVVDLYSGKAFLWGEAVSIILHRLGCPFVLVLRGGGLSEFASHRPHRVRACLKRAEAVTVPSRYLLEQMKSYREDLILLPNPIHLPAYEYLHRPLYNPALAAEVMGLLAPEFPNVELTMLGSDRGDGSWQSTEAAARKHGLSRRLHLPGGVQKRDVPTWLNRGDIFLNTTHVDNTPVSVIEAMACGLCVVSTNVGGIPYLLEDGEDALLVPPDDAPAMAAAVRRILTEPGLAARLSANGRRKVQPFDWTNILASWKELLRSAARKPFRARAA
jgi:glycosyltransferase involved in cell wall biosynthesis